MFYSNEKYKISKVMKKEYVFVALIIIMLYMMYLVLSYKYTEYRINSNIEYLSSLKDEFSQKIQDAESIIEYKNTKAYKNKILKQEQSLKNKWEQVVYLITEKKYDKYTKDDDLEEEVVSVILTDEENLINTMTIYQKWNYFLFGRDIR